MDPLELKALQAPIKERYRSEPGAALITLRAEGRICSGDMLLEALVACAGVTLKAVATALQIPLKDAKVSAEGDLDFRGTLGVAKDASVGFREIRLKFDLQSDAPQEQLKKLLELTERYCVVMQTIRNAVPVRLS